MNKNKKLLAGIVTAGILLAAFIAPSQAAPITYTLQNVTFSDGATAEGSFTFDAATRVGSDFKVSTTEGKLPAFTYEDANSGFYFGGAGPNSFILLADTGRRYFNFSFLSPLSDAGGSFAINTAMSYDCDNCGTFRMVTGGSVTSLTADVPEPATMALLLPSLGVLGMLVRRRQQRKA